MEKNEEIEKSRSKIRNINILQKTNLNWIQNYFDRKYYTCEELSCIINSFFSFSNEIQSILFSKLNSIIFDQDNDISIIQSTLNSISPIVNSDLFFENVTTSLDFFPHYLEFLITKISSPLYQQFLNFVSIFLFRCQSLRCDPKVIQFFGILLNRYYTEYDFTYICNAFLSPPFDISLQMIYEVIFPYIYKVLHFELNHSIIRSIKVLILSVKYELQIDLNYFLSNLNELLSTSDDEIVLLIFSLLSFCSTNIKPPENLDNYMMQKVMNENCSFEMKKSCLNLFINFFEFWNNNFFVYFPLFEFLMNNPSYEIRSITIQVILLYLPNNVPYSSKLCRLLCDSFDLDNVQQKIGKVLVYWINTINDSDLLDLISIIKLEQYNICDTISLLEIPELKLLSQYIEGFSDFWNASEVN